ncbi:calcium-transporting ATPase 1-like isoform X2 [Salvia hispanica]|uniref:calcium-transporting ATPase 1-like isoform X2 n=1 Tax=Salvia hispanica TaxID=49212 RepID=UPI002008F7E1|nr:calcium-transporting ATPase 1-like isoform X2 [Salvia hispanica]
MESLLREQWEVQHKHAPEEALQRWRGLCGVVKNHKRRFRFTANLSKRYEAAAMRKTNHEKFRVALLVSKAAFQFIQGMQPSDDDYTIPKEVKDAGFKICAEELESIVEGHDLKKLKQHGGVTGVADKLATDSTTGIPSEDSDSLDRRRSVYGTNTFQESEQQSFWMFVYEALQDMTLMILGACALLSLIVGIPTEGWPKGAHDGVGIAASILLVVFVTATSDYQQSLQFKDLDKEKKKVSVQVTRNGYREKMSIYSLLAGDIVHLSIGDQVPADGLFLSGFSLLIDESSLTGESEPVVISLDRPFLLSGTKVQDGSCKMLVTTVGMRTQWGKLMATLSEGGNDETPLQVKLNGVATIIGKVGLLFAVVTFAVLVQKMLSHKWGEHTASRWSGDDALELLDYFAIAVTIVVVAVPEGLPLAVTLSLAFAMKKMMNDKALVRHLAACETMGSATNICSDKTGTLTTNRMTVVKCCISLAVKDLSSEGSVSELRSQLPESVLKTLLQSIFNNTGGEVVVSRDGKQKILGTPTEAAILELGLALGGDFQAERLAYKVVKLEPFNSTKKRMGVVLELPEGGLRAHTKGASEIVLAACNKALNSDGEVVPMDEISINRLKTAIDEFANEALRTLCLAYMELGPVFRELSLEELHQLVPKIQVMARSSPMDKHTLVKHLRTTFNEVVAVTGDGTNDAPALHEADIGLAMGIAGTEVAKESADVIILDDNFSTIVTVAKWGRSVYVNIQKFVQFQLTVNVVALAVNFYSACKTGSAPLTAVQLLWVNMIMDTLGALALATEPPNDELMKRPPVGRKGNFISNIMWRNILGQSIYQFLIIWFLQKHGKTFFFLHKHDDSDLVLNTIIFNTFVFCQLFNEVNSREMEKIDVLKGILDNYVFVIVLGSTVFFQIIIIECLGTFASTAPLTIMQWFFSIFMGFLGMPIAVLLKKHFPVQP